MPGKIWLLYRPEPFTFDSDDNRAIHLWVRRCEVFTSREGIDEYFEKLLGYKIEWRTHELFFELEIGHDKRGFRWLVVPCEPDPQSRF